MRRLRQIGSRVNARAYDKRVAQKSRERRFVCNVPTIFSQTPSNPRSFFQLPTLMASSCQTVLILRLLLPPPFLFLKPCWCQLTSIQTALMRLSISGKDCRGKMNQKSRRNCKHSKYCQKLGEILFFYQYDTAGISMFHN